MTNDKIEYELKGLYEHLHLDEDVYDYCSKIEKSLKERFEAIDQVAEYNQLKAIHAMQKNRVSERHFAGTTGYGYDDDGRDTLEKVYADIFHTEDALVRPHITCGTHALTVALIRQSSDRGMNFYHLWANQYDTLEGVIGIRSEVGSLAEYGVT